MTGNIARPTPFESGYRCSNPPAQDIADQIEFIDELLRIRKCPTDAWSRLLESNHTVQSCVFAQCLNPLYAKTSARSCGSVSLLRGISEQLSLSWKNPPWAQRGNAHLWKGTLTSYFLSSDGPTKMQVSIEKNSATYATSVIWVHLAVIYAVTILRYLSLSFLQNLIS